MKYSNVFFLAALASACPTPKDWTLRKWDAIIVGAGTSGIIVADRLSEAGLSTLLLEQGGASYGITGGTERPSWLEGTELSRVDVPGLCMYSSNSYRFSTGVANPCVARLYHFRERRLELDLQARCSTSVSSLYNGWKQRDQCWLILSTAVV